MRRWKQQAKEAEAVITELERELAAHEEAEGDSAQLVEEMIGAAEDQAGRYYAALEEIRDLDHGHPRTAAGAKVAAGRCPVCCLIAEVGV